MPSIKFIDLSDRKRSHVIDGTDFLMGRADECLLQIQDPEVSRRQAKVVYTQGRYRITNTGRNPLEINGQPVTDRELEDGDLLRMGRARFLIRLPQVAPPPSEGRPAHGPGGAPPPGEARGELILEREGGAERVFSLAGERTVIGRGPEARIRFAEKNVSRRHLAIEADGEGFRAVNLSRTSPVRVNGKEIKRCGLKDGDRIEVGDHALRFRLKSAPVPSSKAVEATTFAAQDITWQRPPHLIIDGESGQTRVFDLEKDRCHIGRDPQCDLCFDDPSVSRRHARIEKTDGAFWIENLSRTAPTTVNGRDCGRRRLVSGDQLQIGPHTLVFLSKRPEDAQPKNDPAPEHTVFTDAVPLAAMTPRLILDTGADTARTFHLEGDRMVLGRSTEADIRLEDTGVSRIHGAVEKENGTWVAVNLCGQRPLQVNGRTADRTRLYAGDRVQLGRTVLSFMSDRPEDTREVQAIPTPPRYRRSLVRSGVMAMILVLGAYVGYQRLYLPWNASRVLDRAAGAFAEGRYAKGREIIEAALFQGLAVEKAGKAGRLLADATLKELQRRIESGDDGGAETLLTEYLDRHGAESDAFLLWREQDRLRLNLGEKREKAGQFTEAMIQYARVRAESVHFTQAETRLSRLWRSTQIDALLQRLRREAAAGLVKDGVRRADAGQFFTPVARSADLALSAALALVPDHAEAGKKIAAIGRIHRDRGLGLMEKQSWAEAATNLHLALLASPDGAAADIIEALNRCRVRLAENPRTAGTDLDAAAQRVKRIAEARQKQTEDQTRQMVAGLLELAETAVKNGNDLTPYGRSAFAAWSAALVVDSTNTKARAELDALHKRMRKQALEAFAAGSWRKAEGLLGAVLLVVPGDVEIREKQIDCQKRIGKTSAMPLRQTPRASWLTPYIRDS